MSQKANTFLPVSKPEISDVTVNDLVEVIKSGWIATGPKTQLFESMLSSYFDGRSALTMTSNTVGLYTALKALGIGSGDYVITTPLTFTATVNAIELAGATPLFVDVDSDTFNIDVGKIEKLSNPKIKAVMPVHYAGIPVDLEPLLTIAKKNGWRVIEDAAHAMGSYYNGRKIGAFGDIQVFSFHPIKNMTTGEGGCITCKNDDYEFKKFVELFRFHGIDRSIWDRFSKQGNQGYDVAIPGLKFNMSDIQSVIGLHQLQEVEAMNEKRRAIVSRYREHFSGLGGLRLQAAPKYDHVSSCHLFPIVLNDPETRDNLAAFLREYSIGSTPYYFPVHLFSYYRNKYGYKIGDFPIAEQIGTSVLCIPLYPSLTDKQQIFVINKIKEFLENE